MEEHLMDAPMEMGEQVYQTEQASPVSHSLRKAARWLVAIAVFLTPLWFLPFTADVLEFNKEILLMALAGVGLVLFLIDMIKNGMLQYRTSKFYWGIGGMLVAAIIAVIFSVQPYTSLFGAETSRSFSLVSFLSLCIIFFLTLNIFDDRGKKIRDVFICSAALAVLYGVLQVLGIHLFGGALMKQPNFNTVGSLNGLGFFAAALLPLFLVSSEHTVKWQQITFNVLRYVGLVASFFLLVLLNWGPLWILSFITILGYIAFTSATEGKKGKMRFFALPMAVIVIGLFLWIIKFDWTSLRSKLPVEVSPTQSVSYQIAFDAMKKHPLGYGGENFVIAYDQLRPPQAVNNVLFQARFTDATTQLASMMTEGGIPMLVAFAAFLVFFVIHTLKQLRSGFGMDANHGKLWASVLGFVLIFFFYPMTITMLLAFLVLLAVGLQQSEEGQVKVLNLEGKSVYSFVGSIAFIVGLVVVLVGGYFMINQYIANAQLSSALKSTNRNKGIDLLVKSINSYGHDSRAYRLLSQTLILQVADDLKAASGGKATAESNDAIRNKIASTINVAVRSTEMNPADSENWLNRGYVYQNFIGLVNGADQAALNMYDETLKRSPANALAYVRMGNVHLTLADSYKAGTPQETVNTQLNAAEENYKKAIGLYSNYGQALYNLAAVYDRRGELTQAIKQFEKLQATAPRDPSILFQLGLLYYRNDQKDNALRAWEQAVIAFPDYSNAHWYLSLIYEERNELGKALEEVKKIEKLNPNNSLVMERLAKLEAGTRVIPPSTVLEQQPLNNEQ